MIVANKNPVIKKAYAQLKKLSQDEANQMIYDDRVKATRNEQSRMSTAHRQGLEQGLEKGIKQTALNLLQLGVDTEIIIKSTGLTSEEIGKLK